jgi:Zn finger protein HypA/HybF involved in hydrogenase expression|tara:strand:- start:524 stop:769 length:246 start_codon:yes stop_codon:yes gene_type:complete
MRLIKEAQPIKYRTIDGQEVPIIQPEIYQRIYCKNCKNEVDSEEQATGACSNCGEPWSKVFAKDITVRVLEMPPIGAESGD